MNVTSSVASAPTAPPPMDARASGTGTLSQARNPIRATQRTATTPRATTTLMIVADSYLYAAPTPF